MTDPNSESTEKAAEAVAEIQAGASERAISKETADPASLTTEKWTDRISPFGPGPLQLSVRIAMIGFGIVLPILCNLVAVGGSPFGPEWQSGLLEDKLGYVLSANCGWPMYPLLGFAMLSLGMLIADEQRAAKSWIRFGLFTGVPVTAWYLVVFSLTTGGGIPGMFVLLLVAGIGALAVFGFSAGCRAVKRMSDIAQAVFWIFTIIFFGVLVFFPLILIFSLIYLATPAAFWVYLLMSIRTLKRNDLRFSIVEMLVGMTWVGVFFGAIRAIVANSLAEYSKLPLEPPEGCYIVTAAAKGYPAIVGSRRLPAVSGKTMFVNQQLTTFKIAELSLRAISPKVHHCFRFLYNRIGPFVAVRLCNPILATLAYISLKPAEWFCHLVLRIVLGRHTLRRACNLYFERARAAASLIE